MPDFLLKTPGQPPGVSGRNWQGNTLNTNHINVISNERRKIMVSKNNVRVTITLSKETADAFRIRCDQIGCSVSALIMELVEGFIFEYDGGKANADSD